jgi:putative ABC transport system substrate-binding protein
VSFLANTLLPKQVEVLHEAVAKNVVIGFLVNPTNPNADSDTADVASAAAKLGRKLVIAKAKGQDEIDDAFSLLLDQKVGALLIFPDALFSSTRARLIELVSRHKLPSIYNSRDFAVSGGLIGYGANQAEAYRNAGIYAGRILKGEKPADLPVMQTTTVDLVVNLKTAKALGIEIPQTLLARADEIIE